MDIITHRLRWRDVAPEKRRFDELRATQIVSELLREWVNPDPERFGVHYLETCVDLVLVQNFGVWISGWRSSSDGGPVTSSLNLDDSPSQQVLSVTAAVKQWRSFLDGMDQMIAKLPFSTTENVELQVERAAARLIPMILKKTEAQDAWYNTVALALNWYLEAHGFGGPESRAAVRRTFSAQFQNGVEAAPEQQLKGSQKVGKVVADLAKKEKVVIDCLERWLEGRESQEAYFEHFPTVYPPLRSDGHAVYIKQKERDDRMWSALHACRRWAETSEPLTLAVLKHWQSLVVGKPNVELRTTDAFAKRGSERYCVALLHRLEEFVSQANDESLAPQWRGALLYLDLCFFHPFEDGNARLARLALDAVLVRAGFALNYVEPLFVVARAAEDYRGGTALALAVTDLMGKIPE